MSPSWNTAPWYILCILFTVIIVLHYVKHEYFAILCPHGFSTYGMKRSQFKSILECEFTSAAFWNEGLFANRADGRSDTRRELQGQWTASCHDCVTAGMRGTIIKLSNNKNCTWISLSELGHYMQGNGMTRYRILLNFSHDSSLSRPYQVSRRSITLMLVRFFPVPCLLRKRLNHFHASHWFWNDVSTAVIGTQYILHLGKQSGLWLQSRHLLTNLTINLVSVFKAWIYTKNYKLDVIFMALSMGSQQLVQYSLLIV